jgi:hypothetical protein
LVTLLLFASAWVLCIEFAQRPAPPRLTICAGAVYTL